MSRLAPLNALLRRDLVGGRRATLRLGVRALVLLGSGATAIVALVVPQGGADVGSVGAVVILVGLAALSAMLAPALAVQAFRRERQEGTLDLLLLAGLSPRLLAFGRTLSIAASFEALLAATFPALALLWYFHRPSPGELLVAGVLVTSWNVLAAGTIVAVSAWCRRAAFAAALGVVLVPGSLVGSQLALESHGWMSALAELHPVSALTALLDLEAATPTVPRLLAVASVPTMLGLLGGVLGALVGAAGLARQRAPRTHGDVFRQRIERHRAPVSGRWPLTWILQRSSAGARPAYQALVLPVTALTASIVVFGGWVPDDFVQDLAGPELLGAIGAGAAFLGLLVAAATAASRIAGAREDRTFESLLSTRLPGPRLLADCMVGSIVASVLPLGIGALTTALALRRLHVGWLHVAGLLAAVLTSWVLVMVLGLAASACARTTAGALGLTACLLVLAPALSSMAAAGLDPTVAWGASGWAGVIGVVVVLAGVLSGPLLGAIAARTGRPRWALRRPVGPDSLLAITVVALSLTVLPLASLEAPLEVSAGESFGGAWVLWRTAVAGLGVLDPPAADVALGGVFFHGLLAAAIAAVLLPRCERWIGRAG